MAVVVAKIHHKASAVMQDQNLTTVTRIFKMALINCGECSHEVSDRAESCPKCAAPISGALDAVAAGTQVKTIEETSKKFKLQSLLSIFLMLLSILIATNSDGSEGTMRLAAWLLVIGFTWYLVNKCRVWWHHK